MVLPPIVVDRRFHIFMNSIPYPKGSLSVLIAHFGTFSCKCGIRTEINSLFIRGEANEGNQIATAAESFCGFFTPIFKISCSRLWKNTLARRCRQQREKCKAAVERVRGSLRANQQEGTDAVLPTERLPLLSPATRFRDSGLQIPFHQQYHVCRGYSFAEDSPAIRDSG